MSVDNLVVSRALCRSNCRCSAVGWISGGRRQRRCRGRVPGGATGSRGGQRAGAPQAGADRRRGCRRPAESRKQCTSRGRELVRVPSTSRTSPVSRAMQVRRAPKGTADEPRHRETPRRAGSRGLRQVSRAPKAWRWAQPDRTEPAAAPAAPSRNGRGRRRFRERAGSCEATQAPPASKDITSERRTETGHREQPGSHGPR